MTDTLTEETFELASIGLAEADPAIAAILREFGMPTFWRRPAGFATLCLFIVEQQVSLASAKAVFERLNTLLGRVVPEAVLAAAPEELKSCGLTRQKLRYMEALATDVVTGAIDLTALATLPDAEARARLLSLTGVGPWTADVYLLSALLRPDVWPVGDRALQVGTSEIMGLEDVPTPAELDDLGSAWRPWRSVAARLIWHAYLARRGRRETVVLGIE